MKNIEKFPLSSKIHKESQFDTEIQEEPIDIPFSNESEALCSQINSLLDTGESPVDKKKMQSKIYSTGKAKKNGCQEKTTNE